MSKYRNARYLAEMNEDLDGIDVIQAPEDLVEPVDPEEKTFKKRYGDLRRFQQEEKAQFELRIKALEDQLAVASKAQIKYPKTEEQVAQWMKEFPDVAAIIQTIALKAADDKSVDAFKTRDELTALRIELEQEKAMQRLLRVHPDFTEIRGSDEFHEWAAESLPKMLVDVLYDPNNVDEKPIIRIVDLYKGDMGISKPKKAPAPAPDNRRDAATAVRVPTNIQPHDDGKRTWSQSAVAKLSDREYAKYEDEIDAAIASGKFIRDLTGGAY